MAKDIVTMSTLEMNRISVIQRVLEKRLTQKQAAEMLGLCPRQVRRLCRGVKRAGPRALASRKRGGPSNHRLPLLLEQHVVEVIKERYSDFGPTLVQEKLDECHSLWVSRETLRKWMIAADIWLPRAQRVRQAHQPRRRRECLGELIQIDGSEHAWFEDRNDKCSLLVYVDDATGQLMELRFVEVESAFDYMDATASYLRHHGKPVAFYSDKHSVFRVNQEEISLAAKGITQFGRACKELNIDIICANSPQAKGRVERMNKTLQDRLVKELRLRGISNAVDANAFMPEFMKSYNKRFAHAPRNAHDAHRELRDDENLSDIFSWQEDRKLSQSLVVQFQRDSYLVTPTPATLCLAGKAVRVHQWKDGQVEIRFDNRSLPFTLFDKSPHVDQGAIVENKHLGVVLSAIQITQEKRDEALLASKNLTLRRKARLRAKRAEAATPAALNTGPTSAASAAFAAYFEVFQREQKERNRRQRTGRKQTETTLQTPLPQAPTHP